MIPCWGYPPQKRPDPGRYGRKAVDLSRAGRPAEPKLWTGIAMRKTEGVSQNLGPTEQTSTRALTRALRVSAVALGIGLLFASGVARAQDDDEDDKTFEEKIIEGVMKGIGATNMENSGIDYRERSPLVVPPKLDLPAPVTANQEANVPNWPKDPDEAHRKALAEKRKKDKKDTR